MLMRGVAPIRKERLTLPHRGISLTHPLNPVIFLDIAQPKGAAASGGAEVLPYRFLFELFADLAPILAANVQSLCVGSSTRLVEGRPQPAGYKGTVLHDALVGQYVVGGDVMGGSGSGFFSALGEQHGPLQVPPNELKALAAEAPSRCDRHPGLYMYYWNYSPGTAEEGKKVASTLRIDVVVRNAADQMPPDAVLVGRLVDRDAGERTEAARQLSELAKMVFHAKRGLMQLPVIVLCGEM